VHAQWAKLLESGADPGRVENAQAELNKALKSIEWDLQDLDQTIGILFYARDLAAIAVVCYRVLGSVWEWVFLAQGGFSDTVQTVLECS